MDIESIIYDIETHPIVVAVAIFIILLAGTVLFRKKPTTPVTATIPTPTTSEVYNQTFNSYPTVNPTSQVSTTPVATTLTPHPPTLMQGTSPVTSPAPTPKPAPKPAPKPTPKPAPIKTVQGTYIHPAKFPAQTSTLSGIASHYGISLQKLETMNEWIHQQRHTWDLIYPSDSIRVA
jgi:hypothetical protein